ncbi:MAG: hypothetical protein R3C11_08470 [Planctomycetaceae bacterium]
MRFFLFLFAVALCVTVILGVLCYQTWGISGVIGFCIAIIVGLILLPKLLWFLFKRWMSGIVLEGLKQGTQALKGAKVDIHQVRPIAQPDYYAQEKDYSWDHDEEDPPVLDWYEIDLTITPLPPESEEEDLREWYVEFLEAADLNWKSPEEQFKALTSGEYEEEDYEEEEESKSGWSRRIHRYWLDQDGQLKEVTLNLYSGQDEGEEMEEEEDEYGFNTREEEPLEGEQRLRLEVSIPHGTKEFLLTSSMHILSPVQIPSRLIND